MSSHLLFIGAPLSDVSIITNSSSLEKYHLKADNCIRATKEHRKLFNELLHSADANWTAGGSAQNSARVCKWILGDRGTVSFAGGVGNDAFARQMETQLKKDGVEPLYSIHPLLPTGVCACFITSGGGNRSMVADLGAAEKYNLEDFQTPQVMSSLQEAQVVFVTGYFLAHSAEVAMAAAKFCCEKDKLFALSLSATYVCSVHVKILMECMEWVDVVFGNNEEAVCLLETLGIKVDGDDSKACAKEIANFPKTKKDRRLVVITNGGNPVSICENGQEPKEFPVPPLDDFVDSIGCGDAMAGGFLATFAASKQVDDSVQSGIVAAIKIARTRGCLLD